VQVDRVVIQKNHLVRARIATMLALLCLAIMALAPRASYAISFGVVSATQKPGSSGGGCASCHNVGGTSAGSATGNVASVVISGPTTLDAGASGIYTVTLSQVATAIGVKAGINVEASDGVLSNVAGQSTVIESGQVKHTTVVGPLHATNASGMATYQFRYTMPSNAAASSTHTLYAVGAIGTENGWRHAANFTVTTGAALTDPPRLANISTRLQVLTGENVLIGGFIIGGSAAKTVVVRARGPSLAAQGVPGTLANPNLQLFSGATQIAQNNDWSTASNATAIQQSGFAPSDGNESAIMTTLNPGAYTAIVTGVAGGTGVAIVEVFEVDAPTVPLINISTRGLVQTGDNVMIGGFIIQGNGPQTVVVRARGPSLVAQGVSGVLANPNLQFFSGATQIAQNNDWGQAANAAAIQASGFAPSDPNESAIMMTLNPGAYTAIVTGVAGGTGVAIVEVFTTTASP
jgi:hypothetical protein